MADYTWHISGPEDRELAGARGRRIDFNVDAPSVARFTLDGYSEEAAAILPFETDLHVYRDNLKIFRGRITTEQDTISASSHVVSFSAVDYRGLLDYRFTGETERVYSGIDQGQIAWDLIDWTQGLTDGDWGVTEGVGSVSGTTRDRTYAPGSKIGELITNLGRTVGGFEWTINPDLELDRWYPRRGSDNGVQLDYGGLITSLTRTLSPANYAETIIGVGSSETDPKLHRTSQGAARGRWEAFRGWPTIKEQDTLDDRVEWLRDEMSVLRPGYSCQLRPGTAWQGPSHVWLGDTVGLQVNSGRLAVNTTQRIVTLGLEVTDSDNEVIYLGLLDDT